MLAAYKKTTNDSWTNPIWITPDELLRLRKTSKKTRIMFPPLIITKSQVDDLVTALRKAIELTIIELRNKGLWTD